VQTKRFEQGFFLASAGATPPAMPFPNNTNFEDMKVSFTCEGCVICRQLTRSAAHGVHVAGAYEGTCSQDKEDAIAAACVGRIGFTPTVHNTLVIN
jgi:hypothetical protein